MSGRSSSRSSEVSCEVKVLDCKPTCCSTNIGCQPCGSQRARIIDCDNSSSSSDSCSGVSSTSLIGRESCSEKKSERRSRKSEDTESCTDKFSKTEVSCHEGSGKKYRYVPCRKFCKVGCPDCQESFSSSSSGSCRAPKLPPRPKHESCHDSSKHEESCHESSHKDHSHHSHHKESCHESSHKDHSHKEHDISYWSEDSGSGYPSKEKTYKRSKEDTYHTDHGWKVSGKKEKPEKRKVETREVEVSSASSWLGLRGNVRAKQEKGGTGGKSEFHVSLVKKEDHPWSHRIVGSDHGFTVGNGKGSHPGGIIHVYRGKKYVFHVQQKGNKYPMYFTTDPIGGSKGKWSDSEHYAPEKIPGTPDPVSNGRMVLNVDESLPSAFYYQCSKSQCMGGLVIVHRRK